MARELALLDGTTYFLSNDAGDIDVVEAEGYFHSDMRHLSDWRLLVDGDQIHVLASTCVDYYSARVVGTLAGADRGTNPPVSITRDRFVLGGVHEDITVENHSDDARELELEVVFGCDFADILECKDVPNKAGSIDVETGERAVTLRYRRNDFERATRIVFTAPCDVDEGRAVFRLRLAPRERWKTCADVVPVVNGKEHRPRRGCGSFGQGKPDVPLDLDEWLAELPRLETGRDGLAHAYRRSLVDLAALRFLPLDDLEFAVIAAGLPWFMALFGRDSLITAYELLPFEPRVAKATLTALARLQATEDDPFRDAEPGKILHEFRFGELAVLGDRPHHPYYGSHGATLLFLIVLDEYERWTGDGELVQALEPAARAALEWLDRYGDRDGDGFVEYRRRSPSGLENQGWKDSGNAICFADGRLAEPPIATCELQGYAYDARVRAARLARDLWGDADLAARLDRDAERLRARFERAFWNEGRRHVALALDARKQQVDSLASNIGQLLWSGILGEELARETAARLLQPDMFTGFGIRTMSSLDAAFNPIEYHNGTVWPHDTALIAEGMRRYGLREEASALALALIEAAEAFGHRLPEVFAGFQRDVASTPVEYPTASQPHAWAAGSVLLALRTLLGLDAERGSLRSDPHLPAALGDVRLRGVRIGGRRDDVEGSAV